MESAGKERDGDGRSLDAVIGDIDEEVEEQELVQYLTPGRRSQPLWGLLILTASALHVVYGQETNWLGKLLRTGTTAHHRVSVRFDEIEKIDLPPRGGLLRRLIQGPTRTASIVTADEHPLELEVDDRAAGLVEIARSRSSESR